MDIHGISKDIPCTSIYQAYEGGLHIRGIYQAYSRHIPKIGVPDGVDGPGLVIQVHILLVVQVAPHVSLRVLRRVHGAYGLRKNSS